MPAQLPVTKRSVTWRLQLYSAIFGFLLILKLCSVGSAVAEQISVAVGAQAHELVVRERRQIQPDLRKSISFLFFKKFLGSWITEDIILSSVYLQ